ncbi:MAG: cytochrome C oxidase subunit II, partial [Treponema sp.]|nr:cytochrome C oxidase subunit II [Treponema sp.]
KEKLYNYFNQNYQNMFNRYMVTAEDEMVKKVRSYIDKEETKVLARYTPTEISNLLDEVGGADKFNTGEIEKSTINMYGHLQGHIQRGVNELENLTNGLLRQKTDTGAFIRGENAYSIVKCAFKDNLLKPMTVTDVKLSVNILDSELISPVFHYQATVEYLIKELLSKHLIDAIDGELEKVKDQRMDQGQEELSDSEIIFAKLARVEHYTDDEAENPRAKRYALVAKGIMDRLSGLRAEIDPAEYDQLNVRENLKKIVDIENIRTRGFNTAVNSITSILDTSKMGYQYIENFKNARELLIREYEDTDADRLPDERYQVRMRYYDNAQLIEERKAYDVQMKSFENEIQHLWDALEVIYQGGKPAFRVADFQDLAAKQKARIRKTLKAKNGEPVYEDIAKVWDEITFIQTGETEVEKMNRTYIYEKDKVHQKIIIMRDRMRDMYDYRYPVERRVMEDRLNFLEKEFNRFDYMINPYHIQPGLLLDVDITSLKRKKVTLNGMANVLNEFLHGVSKGFQDAAFASFSRRGSTVREDITQSFSGFSAGGREAAPIQAPAQAYLDMLNSDDGIGGRALESAARPSGKARKPAKPPAKKAKAAAAKPVKRGDDKTRSRSGGGRSGVRQI